MSSKQYKALFLVIGVLTMAGLIYSTGVEEIAENLGKMGYWFVPVIGSWLIIYLLNAWAFYTVIREPSKPETDLPFARVLQLTISGYAINYVTPFISLGGEPYRIMELTPKVGVEKASSSVLLYSMMHMFSHILFWLFSVVLILAFLPLSDFLMTASGVLLIVGFLLGYLFLIFYKRGFVVTLTNRFSKLPFVGRKISDWAEANKQTLNTVDIQIRNLLDKRKSAFYGSLALEFAARLVGCAEIYYTANAIHMDMSWLQALIVSSGSSLFANVVFFFPMQFGAREGGLALALKSVGMVASTGVFISIVTRIREIVWIAIGYGLMYLSDRRTRLKAVH